MACAPCQLGSEMALSAVPLSVGASDAHPFFGMTRTGLFFGTGLTMIVELGEDGIDDAT